MVLTEINGVRVGHWTNSEAMTGCTVVVLPEGTVASGEVRGGAPATRDFALLDPLRLVTTLDAVVLSGGSAFGLDACAGVMGALVEAERGFTTAVGKVPIVVGMSLFDLGEGDGTVRPTAQDGRSAFAAATAASPALGRVGAGAGATVSKWRGREHAQPGGLGAAVVRSGELTVAALIAVNATGDIDDGTTMADIAAGTFTMPVVVPFENTTIGLVVTNAIASKAECHLVAQSGHDGYARALVPAHTQGDGDAVIAAATGEVEAEVAAVRLLATAVVEMAIRSVAQQVDG